LRNGVNDVRTLITFAFLAASSAIAAAQSVSVPPSDPQQLDDPANMTDTSAGALPKEGDHGENVFALQVALDRARFSPGVIDGHFGRSTRKAVAAYQESQGLEATGEVDGQLWSKLIDPNTPALVHVSVDPGDLGPVGDPLPSKPEDLAGLQALDYGSLAEAVSEKFHTSEKALARLNEGTEIAAGADIVVPNVEGAVATPSTTPVGGPLRSRAPAPENAPNASGGKWQATLNSLSISADQPRAARVAVSKENNEVRVFDDANHLLAAFPATVGSDDNPSPVGDLKITAISHNPRFKYDTDVLGEKGPRKKFDLAAGPNNLVGVVWLDLSKRHNGIHGTSEPQNIGQHQSHGCVRLTNWDAARLAQMVHPGTPATFD
jgi:lipoprotein-anchoring transpeptidase ErfK/SrfK